MTNLTKEFTRRLTEIGIKALASIPAPQVADALMTAALNVALGCMPREAVSEWLRNLADSIEEHDRELQRH